MSQTHLLSDTIARIRNAQMVGYCDVVVQRSKKVDNVLRVLQSEGYIAGFESFEERRGVNRTKVHLKYDKRSGKAVIETIKVVSTPGCKVFSRCKDLKKIYGGLGIGIISTSKYGIITDNEARKANVGGEVLCYVF